MEKSIGIIANPASGKDIRRLVSYATVIDNNEKVNIVKRIVLAAQGMGIERFYFMPDTFQIGYQVIESLRLEKMLSASCEILEMPIRASAADSITAAREMLIKGIGAIVVLGGDGTSRAVAKEVHNVPMLPISTGTNNVYPEMTEGTVAGMAAAAVALAEEPYESCIRDKWIEVWVNGQIRDVALIDAVISDNIFQGAKALWDMSQIRRIIVSRCHPASIGFSAVAGCLGIISPDEDRGMMVELGETGKKIKAPVAAGLIETIGVKEHRIFGLGEHVTCKAHRNCMVALDGEREIKVREGDTLAFCIRREGPWRIEIRKALKMALERGLYNQEE